MAKDTGTRTTSDAEQTPDHAKKKPGSKGGAVLGDINRESKAEPDDRDEKRDHEGNIISELNDDEN